MKKLISTLVITLLMTTSLFAQELSRDLYYSFKNDNATTLKNQISDTDINTCYEIKGGGYTLLALSIKTGAKECFKYILEQNNLDLDKACTGKAPLLYAAKYGQLEMLKALQKAGANPSVTNQGKTVQDYARKYDHQEIVEYLNQQ